MGKALQIFDFSKLEDYQLLSKIQQKLTWLPAARTKLVSFSHCCRAALPTAGRIDVITATDKDSGLKRAYYGLVTRCHSGWICPVCAVRYLTLQANVITNLIQQKCADGYQAFMLTLTVPHNRNQSAAEVYKLLKDCKRRMRGTYAYKLQKKLEIRGSITATECTYGFYGFHFHQHILFFIPKDRWGEVEKFEATYKNCWERAIGDFIGESYDELKTNPRSPTKSVYLSRSKTGAPLCISNGDYVCEFGREISKAATMAKRSVRGRSMFEMAASDDPEDFCKFIEYALATKGTARIAFSNDLRRQADQLYDAEKKTHDANTELRVEASFQSQDWFRICEDELYTERPHRVEILRAVLDGGLQAVIAYCSARGLPCPYEPVCQIKQAG